MYSRLWETMSLDLLPRLLLGLLSPLLCLMLATLPGCTADTSCSRACSQLEMCNLSGHGAGLRDIVCGEDPCGGDIFPDKMLPDDAEGQAGCVVAELNKIAQCLLWADGGLWDPIDPDRFCGAIDSIVAGSPVSIQCLYVNSLELVPHLHDRLSTICRISLPSKK
jgi:hypothetical protein